MTGYVSYTIKFKVELPPKQIIRVTATTPEAEKELMALYEEYLREWNSAQ